MVMGMITGCDGDDPLLEQVENPVPETPGVGSTSDYLLYSSDQDGNFSIWLKHEDTESRVSLLDGDSWWPRITSDQSKILFYSSTVSQGREVNDYSTAGLWVMNFDGSDRKEIVPANAFGWEQHGFANWSPDGNSIVMCALDPKIGAWQLYIVDASGQNPTRISMNDEIRYFDPVFSPDGKSVACIRQPLGFEELDESRYEVFLIDLDNETETQLTDNNHRDHHPDFSSDGERIVFESLTDQDYLGVGKWALKVVNISSKTESDLLHDENINIFPRYSADDQVIYFNQVDLTTFNLRLARLSLENGSVSYLTTNDFNAMNVDPF